ncbi:hypothetical protein C2E20_0455 [Micractinium conductrix]|uniref:Uncharacterized protein n=1 Tax=Micractinium conductrix TaxID=554055 RepID=A0A2P6VR31_9CHLO|nr:hypothetical protein C2E20_0455 [Micractinium conductrix]|eukprot:PSC76544.1 hypothetical protein C2E20_0455 [Micractinium conductrix]
MKAPVLALLLLALCASNAWAWKCDIKLAGKNTAQRGWLVKPPITGNMRPLECPAGFEEGPKDVLERAVLKWFYDRAQPQLVAKGDRYGCDHGVKSAVVLGLNGCLQTWPKSVAKSEPTFMAQGKVRYTCVGAPHKKFLLGIDSEGVCKY